MEEVQNDSIYLKIKHIENKAIIILGHTHGRWNYEDKKMIKTGKIF